MMETTAPGSAAPSPLRRARAMAVTPAGLVGVLVAVGVVMRLYRFTEPILDQHAFRQTQTASNVWLWDRFGFDLLDYRVPMLGAGHWVLEFPVYQAVVWLLAAPFGGIEPIGRLVSIAAFVGAAVLLYLLACRFTGRRAAAVAAVAVFAVLPADVFYYRAVMIDPLLIALTLLALYAAVRLAESFTWRWFAVLAPALLLSVLGKATLMLAIGLPVVVLGVRILASRRATLAAKGALVALAATTLLCSALWTRHADDLNLASGSLTFSNGRDWFFGTTFTDPGLFRTVGQRFLDNLGVGGVLLVALGLAAAAVLRTPYRLELAAMVAGGALSICVFANLNRIHDYYQLPYYVTLSMLAGLGAALAHDAIGRISPVGARVAVVAGVGAVAVACASSTWDTYFAPAAIDYGARGQALELRAATPDRRLLVLQEAADKHSPALWYEARRIGWRVPTADEPEARRIARTPDLGGVVFLRGPSPEPAYVARIAAARGFSRTHDSPTMVVYGPRSPRAPEPRSRPATSERQPGRAVGVRSTQDRSPAARVATNSDIVQRTSARSGLSSRASGSRRAISTTTA